MTRAISLALLLLALASGLGCGKYGRPVRPRPAAAQPGAAQPGAAPASADPSTSATPPGEACEPDEEKPAP